MSKHMFSGRKLLIASKHGKEEVMAPLLEQSLGVTCVVSPFDTDCFGTFSGEKEREYDPVETLRKKCRMALSLNDGDLAIASEGSFGPHPSLVFVPADDELVMLIDVREGIEVVGRELSTVTNFDACNISTYHELVDFADRVKFPSHGLILRRSKNDLSGMKKGVTKWHGLKNSFNALIKEYGRCYLETDMRAMMNPTRMSVIRKATENLLERLQSFCPVCGTSGFGVTSIRHGLPCSVCGTPTRSALGYIHSCEKCKYIVEESARDTLEDPHYCDRCNP